jgi:hypothetical protein
MPAVLFFLADGNQNTGWFPSFENSYDLIGLSFAEIGLDEFVASAVRCVQNRNTPFWGALGNPALKLLGDFPQDIAADRILLAVSGKEPDNSFGLLKGLNETVAQNTVEATVAKSDMILVVLVESVHGCPPRL